MTRCRGAAEAAECSCAVGPDAAYLPDSARQEANGRDSQRPLELLDAHLTALAMAGSPLVAGKRPRP